MWKMQGRKKKIYMCAIINAIFKYLFCKVESCKDLSKNGIRYVANLWSLFNIMQQKIVANAHHNITSIAIASIVHIKPNAAWKYKLIQAL